MCRNLNVLGTERPTKYSLRDTFGTASLASRGLLGILSETPKECSLSQFRGVSLRGVRRRQWHPTPVLLPGKSHGWRSLVVHGVAPSRTRLKRLSSSSSIAWWDSECGQLTRLILQTNYFWWAVFGEMRVILERTIFQFCSLSSVFMKVIVLAILLPWCSGWKEKII